MDRHTTVFWHGGHTTSPKLSMTFSYDMRDNRIIRGGLQWQIHQCLEAKSSLTRISKKLAERTNINLWTPDSTARTLSDTLSDAIVVAEPDGCGAGRKPDQHSYWN